MLKKIKDDIKKDAIFFNNYTEYHNDYVRLTDVNETLDKYQVYIDRNAKIVNELEKYIKNELIMCDTGISHQGFREHEFILRCYEDILTKLKELKKEYGLDENNS